MRVVLLLALAACGRISFDARNDGGGTIGDGDAPLLPGTCNVSDVAVGRAHTCMIEGAGTVWCWGRNGTGRTVPGLVDPTGYIVAPAAVVLPRPAVQLAAGRVFTCARLDNGDVYCWGDNFAGSLGDGTTEDRAMPVQVALGGETAIDIAAGTYFACARVASDQSVHCWGENLLLQAGTTPASASVPMPTLVASTAGASQLSIGHKHSCMIDGAGATRCWGRNEAGQLGGGAGGSRASPDPVPLLGAMVNVDASGRHTCVADAAGDVRCWGLNRDGQLGRGSVTVADLTDIGPIVASNVDDLELSPQGSCVLHRDKTISCWGHIDRGDGTHDRSLVATPSTLANVDKLALAYGHACAIMTPGRLACWGNNLEAELGRGQRGLQTTPVSLAQSGIRLAAGRGHMCAIVGGATVACWGQNSFGPLGDGTRDGRKEPVLIDVVDTAAGITAGDFHTCTWSTAANTVRCWGFNRFRQVTSPVTVAQLTPTLVAGIAAPLQVAAGNSFTCAIDGTNVECWGDNSFGQLGNGTMTSSGTPVQVMGGVANPTQIAAGPQHACAIAAGRVLCWGSNVAGQLGDGSTLNRSVPVDVGLMNITEIALGAEHTCALGAGNLWCWGDNGSSQLGIGAGGDRTTPTLVTLPGAAARIFAGEATTCAVLGDGRTYCWGLNEHAQYGDGTFTGSNVPQYMPGFDGVDQIEHSTYGGCRRRGTVIDCWGDPHIAANGDYSDAEPRPPMGCE